MIVCDGAMGTMLHSAGVPLDQSLSELNVSRPRLVRDLHAAYLAAGADLVQTNTFDANRLRLARVGQQDRVAEINIAGARLAREAVQEAGRPVLVAGSVGPAMSATLVPRIPAADRSAALREQIAALADWVDVILLETFGEIESLTQAVAAALRECDLPVVAQMTFGDDGRTLRGEEPAEVATALAGLGVTALGANCTVGPAVLQDVVAALAAHCALPVFVQPNAGTPRRLGRRLHYAHNTEYFAEAAVRLVGNGATAVGGCCGTTPGHVRAVAKAVAGLVPTRTEPAAPGGRDGTEWTGLVAVSRPPVGWPDIDRPVVVAALRPPHGADVPGFVERARELVAAGADMLAIVDPELASTRVGPVAAAVLLSERVRTTVILQVETAERTLPALQADLLGAHAFGLHTVVCRTGNPRVVGDYPATPVSDVDSIRLIATLAGLNEGVDWRGVPIPERTRFVIGAVLRTATTDRPRELERAMEKVGAGVHFFLTDVVYDASQAHDMLLELRARGVTLPVIAAVAPFRDAQTITRLTHETPEVAIPAGLPGELGGGHGIALEVAEKLGDRIAGILVHIPRGPELRSRSVVADLSRACRGGVGEHPRPRPANAGEEAT